MEDVVIAAFLVEFGTLARRMSLVPVEDDARWGDGLCGLFIQLADGDDTLQLGTAAGIGVYQVDLSVVVPQGARVNDALSGLHQYGFGPRPLRVAGLGHKDSLVRISPENVELAVVVAYSGCPYAVAVFGAFGGTDRSEAVRNGCTDDAPVDQIVGMQYLQARQAVEAGAGHVEVIAYAAGIGVGIVGIEDGVLISAVAPVGYPYLRYVLFLLGRHWQGCQQPQAE